MTPLLRTACVVASACAWAAAQDAPAATTSVTVATRRFEKDERARSTTQAIETQRMVAVPLPPAGPGRFEGHLESQGRSLALALHWDGAAGSARFGVDADADGAIEEPEWQQVAVQRGGGEAAPRVQFAVPLIVTLAGRTYGLQVRRYEDGEVRAEVSVDVDYCRGEAEVDGVAHTLLVVDWDDDARFGSAGDVFTFLPSAQFTALPSLGAGRGFMYPIGDAAIVGEQRARLSGVVGDDGRIEVALGPPAEPLADYLRRRRARAVAALAPGEGPKDQGAAGEGGIEWLWLLDAAPALAAAKAAGRPLFLLFENEPDPTCARMDAETFCHPAVAEAAQPFLCARVTIELDVTRSNRRFDVRLGPAYVFCSADGRPLMFPDRRTGLPVAMAKGFKAPAEMAALLRTSAKRLAAGEFD